MQKRRQVNASIVKPGGIYRATAVIVGILFIIGTVSGVLSGVVTAPIRTAATFPLNVAASQTQWITGALLVMLMGVSLAMMPVVLYPVFREHNRVLAAGAVLFRGAIEAISYALMVISMLLMVTVSELQAASGAEAAIVRALGTLVEACRAWTEMWGAVIFGIGGLMIFSLFYQTRLVPRWLSAWALIGGALYIVANLAALFTPLHKAPDIGSGIGLLLIPTALQEMVFAVWLIVKGFSAPAVAALRARQA
jgi:hypothetical protein